MKISTTKNVPIGPKRKDTTPQRINTFSPRSQRNKLPENKQDPANFSNLNAIAFKNNPPDNLQKGIPNFASLDAYHSVKQSFSIV